ncbi:hypothetical protein VYU27_010157 [Nannochloropsis oceanica]
MTKDEVLAAASRAASKMAAARVKRLEGDVEIWRREQRSNYASIADTNLRLEIARVQKEKEIELDAMRKKNDPRITERARREEEYNASLHKTRQQVDTLKVHILELSMKYFDRVWGLLTRRAVVIDGFKADVTLYYKEDDRLNLELVDRIQDVVQWEKLVIKAPTAGRLTRR